MGLQIATSVFKSKFCKHILAVISTKKWSFPIVKKKKKLFL